MARTSAGLLAYRVRDGVLEVFVGHMGGPLWGHRDEGAWSIPKGLYDPAQEEPLAAARREFAEEIGVEAPAGDVIDLGEHVQRNGKVVRTFAVEVNGALEFVASNHFEMEWPRGTGMVGSYPEIDRAQWLSIEVARTKVLGGQVQILDALARQLGGDPGA